MRRFLTPLVLLFSLNLVGQGFSTTATNWGLPTGGYLDNGITYGFNALSGGASNLEDQGSQSWNLVDMNGDGLTDLVVPAEVSSIGYTQEFSPNSNSFWKVYLNSGSGFSTSATNWSLPAGGALQNGIIYGFNGISGQSLSFQDNGTQSWSLVDMNGDERPDLVVTAEKGSSGYVQEFSPNSNSFWKVYLNTGSGFSTSATNWGLPTGGLLQNGIIYGFFLVNGSSDSQDDTGSQSWSLLDVTGDGRPDLVVTSEKGNSGYNTEFSPNSNSYWKVYTNTGSGFSTNATNWGLPAGGYLDNGITYGYNRVFGESASFNDTGSQTWALVDMGGDGRPDLVVAAQLGSNGYVQEFSPNSNSYWKVHLNTGSGFSTSATNWALPEGGYLDNGIIYGYNALGATAFSSEDVGSQTWGVVDLNTDGRPDLVVPAQLGSNGYIQEFSPNSNSYWKVHLNTGSGFSNSATNWGLPAGGYLDNGIIYGYNALGATAFSSEDVGSQTWSLASMNGDGSIDLVVPAQLGSNGYVQEFSPNSNSFWKVFLAPNFTSIDEQEATGMFMLYPNPSTGLVNIEATAPITAVEVLDMSGRCVLRSAPRSDRAVLQLDGLATGTYVVRVATADRIQQRTLLLAGDAR